MHSELPPSSSDKWLECTGWRKLNATIPRSSGGAAAQEGTDAHTALAEVLAGTLPIEEVKNSVLYDAIASICTYIVRDDVTVHSEIKVDFGELFGYVGLTGTSDLILEHPEYLEVVDFKYGRQSVEVYDNPQMLTYLVGAIGIFGRRPTYRITIAQPRDNHFDGPIRTQEITDSDLRAFEQRLEKAISDSYVNPVLKIGPHCRNYCNALSVCPAVRESVIGVFREAAND